MPKFNCDVCDVETSFLMRHADIIICLACYRQKQERINEETIRVKETQ